MTPTQLRDAYLKNFTSRQHAHIPSAPLLPVNDPSTLFTSSGMQPLVPYLLGQPHPEGKRLVNSQKCFRSQDIEDVGDNRHTTFFEMLGNWSLGDYFKSDQLAYFLDFLTNPDTGLGLDPSRLYVTVFSGDKQTGIGRDEEATEIWKELFKTKGIEAEYLELETEEQGAQIGMKSARIFGYSVAKNWWSRSGVPANMPVGEPGGPDSEVFYDFGAAHDPAYGKHCHPNCDCGRFMEIGNSVFMQYHKTESGSLEELAHKNVDFGGGFERLLAATTGVDDVFRTALFWPLIQVLEELGQRKYDQVENQAAMRIVADHIRASVFLVADGVEPSNKAQGYFLRRLIRRTLLKLKALEITDTSAVITRLTQALVRMYQPLYLTDKDVKPIAQVILAEAERFSKSLAKGLKAFEKTPVVDGKVAFDLLQTYGFPLEITIELAQDRGQKVDREEFTKEFRAHQELSRTSSKGMFKGGLADQSEATTKLHTATHLLHKALQSVLGDHVRQEGSHITADRLRFDFTHHSKLTGQELEAVELEINQVIKKDLSVTQTMEQRDEAIASGAMAFFREKYPDKVSVYTIGAMPNYYSRELCGGPHVGNTGQIGGIRLTKQEAIGANKRRIYAEIVS